MNEVNRCQARTNILNSIKLIMRGSVQMGVPVQMTRIGPDFWTGPCPSASYTLKYIIKNCHQHSCRFQNLMSSWGWGNTIFKITL